jgi:type IV secretion system protein VirB9
VVTSQRRYTFDLHVAAKGASPAHAAYVVQFLYPQVAVAMATAEPAPDLPPEELNSAYVVTGSTENRPAKVFDDGRMTYFAWGPQAAIPAIFAASSDGKESLVNHGVRNGYTVVEQLAGRFVLRNGKQVATVDNKGYGAAAPVARSAR